MDDAWAAMITPVGQLLGRETVVATAPSCPFEVALEYCTARRPSARDRISDAEAAATVGQLVTEMSDRLVQLAAADSVAVRLTPQPSDASPTSRIDSRTKKRPPRRRSLVDVSTNWRVRC